MNTLLQDIRYTLRSLAKSPGYTAIAVLVLGLGIGADTAVFSVVNAVLLRPLPYPDADRLIVVRQRSPTVPSASVSFPDYVDWRAAQRSFQDLAIMRRDNFNVSFGPLGGGAAPERVNGTLVSANYLPVLGITPTLGRNFSEAEDTPGAAKVVLLGDGLWRRRFGANPAVVGQRVTVDGEPREVIGVLPALLNGTRGTDIYEPLGDLRKDPGVLDRRNHPGLSSLGRLKPGVTLAQARQDLDAIQAEISRRYPESDLGWTINAQPMLEQAVGPYRHNLYLLLGAVGCVLLIACANVANLQLARATGRTKELAVRAALGASRWRLVRQMLTESAVLGVLGGLVGVLLALWAMDAIIALSPTNASRFKEARLDPLALGFTALVALGTGLLAGAWPAWRVSRAAAMAAALHDSSARGASGGAGQGRTRAILVVAQVALAVVLLTGAGLTLKAFYHAQNEPLGFDPKSVLMLSVLLPEAHYPPTEQARLMAFHNGLLERVRALPGVASAALAGNTPFSGSDWETSYHVTGTPPDAPGKEPESHITYVTADYFKSLGMPILRGRDFGPEDQLGRGKTVIIDERLARAAFPDRDPVGQHLDDNQTQDKNPPPLTIIGVVGHVRRDAPGVNPTVDVLPAMYTCAMQTQSDTVRVVVRAASGDPSRLAESVRRIVQNLDPELPVSEITTMQQEIAASLAPQRLTMTLLGTFALLALALATVGLYGVMALSVTQRTRELGIRLALGAQRSAALSLVMRQGAKLVAIGLGVGLLAALATGQMLASVFYGVSGNDLFTLAGVCVVLAGAALLACWLPARRATRVDPMIALRNE